MGITAMDTKVLAEYRDVIKKEIKLRSALHYPNWMNGSETFMAEEMYETAWKIFEVSKNACYFFPFSHAIEGADEPTYPPRTVGGHLILTSAIAEAALDAKYETEFGNEMLFFTRTDDGYSYRDIMGHIRSRDFSETELLSFSTGRLIYLSERTAEIILALTMDMLTPEPPMVAENSTRASELERREMRLCDFSYKGKCKISEMMSIDFFALRKFVDYDENLFFTALILMCTLIVNNCWYSWRELQYLEQTK